jgi:hypothetical protein
LLESELFGHERGGDGRRDRQCRAANHRPGSARQPGPLNLDRQWLSARDNDLAAPARCGSPQQPWRDSLPKEGICRAAQTDSEILGTMLGGRQEMTTPRGRPL